MLFGLFTSFNVPWSGYINIERYLQSLIRYSAKYWPTHILSANLGVSLPASASKTRLMCITMYEHIIWDKEAQMSSESLIHCAAFHGFTEIHSF